jgi:hypothetical protein
MAIHREFAKQDGKRIQVPLTHAARTSEAKKLQRSLTQEALGQGSDYLQTTGPVLQTGNGCYHTVAEAMLEMGDGKNRLCFVTASTRKFAFYRLTQKTQQI